MGKGNLLIVDDEVMLVKRLKMALQSCADEVFTAYDGLEALEVFKKNTIHCIVCDINMPKMNGVGLIKNLREMKSDVPFIFFTGHGNSELMMEAAKYGAFDFLDKPYFEGLEEVVVKGLALGFNKTEPVNHTEELMSEYQKLLKNIRP